MEIFKDLSWLINEPYGIGVTVLSVLHSGATSDELSEDILKHVASTPEQQ